MFIIDDSKNMYLNRGDQITIILTANQDFAIGDVIKFSIVKENDYSSVVFQKSFTIDEQSDTFEMTLTSDETKLENLIKTKTVTYWYEIELNDNDTLVGYDDDGPKLFVLWPEAPEKEG